MTAFNLLSYQNIFLGPILHLTASMAEPEVLDSNTSVLGSKKITINIKDSSFESP